MSLSTNAQSAEEARESRLLRGLSALILRSRGEHRASVGSGAGESLRLTVKRGSPSLRLEIWIETEPISLRT